jgi:hypothetical protein
LALGLSGSAWGEAATNGAFRVGETLKYNIFWGPVIGGKASLQVLGIEPIDGHDCYHLRAQARTVGLAGMLFPVTSTVDAWLDVEGLFTRQHQQNRVEGSHVARNFGAYDYAQRTLTITNQVNGKVHTLDLTEPVRDLISAVYYLRTQPLKLQTPSEFLLQDSTKKHVVIIKPDERRKIDVRPLGEVDALRIEPKPTPRIVAENNGRAWVWISDDYRRLPLLIVCSMPLGSAKFVLERADGQIAPRAGNVGGRSSADPPNRLSNRTP